MKLFRIFRTPHFRPIFNNPTFKSKMTLDPNSLPPSVKTLADLIGTKKAIALSEYAKHRHIYIPKIFNPNSPLVEVIGRPAAFTLWKEYRGELITVANCNSVKAQALRAKRNANIVRAIGQGMSVKDACSTFSISRTRIFVLLSRHGVKLRDKTGRGV